jgi:hypothetical protein
MSWTDAEVQAVFRDGVESVGGCPPAETLARAMSGDLPREQANLVADHLSECPDCAGDVQALRNLEPWAERTTFEGASPERHTREVARRHWVKHPLAAVAAVLLAATAATTIGLVRARSQGRADQAALQAKVDESATAAAQLRAELTRARTVTPPGPTSAATGAVPNVAIVDLLPSGATRSGAADASTVPAGAPLVVAVLTAPSGTARFAGYTIEVWNGGKLAWRGQGLVRSAEDTFTVALPAHLLAPGPNRVRLLGQRQDRLVPIEDYTLRLP